MSRKPLLFVIVVLGISSIIVCYHLPTLKGTTRVEGHITEDTTWTIKDSPYFVINDVIVDANTTLTIKPGVEVRFGGAFSLVVEGSLCAEGTPGSLINFTSNKLQPQAGDWRSIIMDGYTLAIRYSIITYAFDGIRIDSVKKEAIIEYSTISNCSYSGIYIFTGGHPATAANTRIANNSILFNGGTFPPHPVAIPGSGVFIKARNVTVQDNLISRNTGVGIWVAESSEIVIVGNVISWIKTVQDDVSYSSDGIPMLCGNGILMLGWGLMGGCYDVTILKNRVTLNNGSGIHIAAVLEKEVHKTLIKQNTISANKQNGVWLESEKPLLLLLNTSVLENSIFNNNCGVLIQRSQEPSNVVQYNDIYNNVYGMNVTYAEINAEHNYWGDESGPHHESLNPAGKGNSVNPGIYANLDFIPFLTSPVGTINQRPAAMLDIDKANPWINEIVTFDASASSDDGRIDYYFFDFGDGSNSSWTPLSVITHKYTEEGVYNATLIVMDDFGVTSLDGNLVYTTIAVVPEFPSILVLLLFMLTTLLIAYKRRHNI